MWVYNKSNLPVCQTGKPGAVPGTHTKNLGIIMVCKIDVLCEKCGDKYKKNVYIKHTEACDGRTKLEKSIRKYPGSRGGWNKGISLKMLLDRGDITQEEFNFKIEASRKGGLNCPGQPHDPAARLIRNQKLREAAIRNNLGGHTSKLKIHYKMKDGTIVYLQSSYEIEFAKILDKLCINWSRPNPLNWIDSDGVSHRYYPDFKVGTVYIDTKNDYLAIKDLPKITAVRTQNSIDLRIVTKKNITEEYINSLQT